MKGVERSRGRRKQYLATAGAPGARLRRITPHQAAKQGAMSLCMSAYARVVCERMITSEKIEEGERQRGGRVALGVDEVPSLQWPAEVWV